MPTLILRADANSSIGAGHAMRLATLGAAWRASGGTVQGVGTLDLEFVIARYREAGIALSDRPSGGDAIMVVDSYDPEVRFGALRVAGAVLRVLVDDLGGTVPNGYDAVWNPSPYGEAGLYPGFTGPLLSGPEHLAVREGLPRWVGPSDEVLVSLGGSEPSAQIKAAFDQLAALASDTRFAITGPWGPAGWRRIAPGRLWAEVARAKALVMAAGSTVWEAAAVGIPVVLLETAANQRLNYRWARDAGVPGLKTSLVDGEFLAHQLRALIPAARPLPRVTGGAGQVVAALAQLAGQRMAAR